MLTVYGIEKLTPLYLYYKDNKSVTTIKSEQEAGRVVMRLESYVKVTARAVGRRRM